MTAEAKETAEKLLQLTGNEVTIPLSGELSALACGMIFELLKILLATSFDVEVTYPPKPKLTIKRRR